MSEVLIMITAQGFYPILSSGQKDIVEEANDHLRLNDHVIRVESVQGVILASRTKH